MLIGINGFLESGKDTVYKRIAAGVVPDSLRGMPVVRISFADKLKLSAAAALGVFDGAQGNSWTDEEIIDWMNDVKENGFIQIKLKTEAKGFGSVTPYEEWDNITGREYLQWYGTESHRDVFDRDFWVDQALPADYDHSGKIVCVTDMRFPNEITRVRDLSGKVWNVTGIDNSMAGTHVSETPIERVLVDTFIDNSIRDDNFKNLDDQIKRALASVRPRVNSILR